ncbi:MAG: phosphatase [Beggiatoa sp. IS2]|nr:MAG: phosphatase [Beggiatoa sp. IS2]
MPELTTLLFDVDGTLADTERNAHRVAFNETFATHHLTWYWSETLYGELLAVAGGKERLKFYLTQYHPPTPPLADIETFIALLYRDKTQCYLEIVRQGHLPLRPGIQRLLMEARAAGLQLGIVTTTNHDNVIVLLEHSLSSQAVEWFAVIAAGDVVTAKKPAPDIYHYALAKLGVTANECLAIEDSDIGLRAALGAGISTVITLNDYSRHQDFTGAVLVVDHLGEPDLPFTIINGEVGQARWVDVPLLKRLLA